MKKNTCHSAKTIVFTLVALTFVNVTQAASNLNSPYQAELQSFLDSDTGKNWKSLTSTTIANTLALVDLNSKFKVLPFKWLSRYLPLRLGFNQITGVTKMLPISQAGMPKLTSFLEGLAEKQKVSMPWVVITENNPIGTAVTQLDSNVFVLSIEQSNILELSQDALEFVLAHEMSHIKLDHISKRSRLVRYVAPIMLAYLLFGQKLCSTVGLSPQEKVILAEKPDLTDPEVKERFDLYTKLRRRNNYLSYIMLASVFAISLHTLHTGRRHELEADASAAKYTSKAGGIAFFKSLLKKADGHLTHLSKEGLEGQLVYAKNMIYSDHFNHWNEETKKALVLQLAALANNIEAQVTATKQSLFSLFWTHPHDKDRIAALEAK